MQNEQQLKNLKPPWKKGDPSPNPMGKVPGTKNLTTRLREAVERGDTQAKIILALIEKATVDKDLKAITEIFDRLEGKAKQSLDIEAKVITKLNFKDAE